MTKINEELKPLQHQVQKTSTPVKDGAFKATFDNVLSGIKSTEQKSSVNSLSELSSVNYTKIQSIKNDLDIKTSDLLNKLDQYIQKLSNPDISLKEIEPLISNINKEAGELSIELSKTDENQELKDIAGKSALSANSEYIKFMRGDYI